MVHTCIFVLCQSVQDVENIPAAMALVGHTPSYGLSGPHPELWSWWVTSTVGGAPHTLVPCVLTCVTVTLRHGCHTRSGCAGGTCQHATHLYLCVPTFTTVTLRRRGNISSGMFIIVFLPVLQSLLDEEPTPAVGQATHMYLCVPIYATVALR